MSQKFKHFKIYVLSSYKLDKEDQLYNSYETPFEFCWHQQFPYRN